MTVAKVAVVCREGNRSRGHIALGAPDAQASVTFMDIGPVLRLASCEAVEFDPDTARDLAAELIHWADSKETS